MFDNLCQVAGCQNPAARITATETAYIEVCNECFHRKYKI
jgi:hypothetical protein